MNLSIIYLILLVIGIIIQVLGIVKKNKKLRIISGVFLILLILSGFTLIILLGFSNM